MNNRVAKICKGPWLLCSSQGWGVLSQLIHWNFRTAPHLALDLGPICLRRPDKALLLPTTQSPGSAGHIHPPPCWDGPGKLFHLIVVVHHCQEQQYCRYSRVTGDSIAGCLGSSLGTGWGVCISGWSKTTTLLCGKWSTWGGLGHLIKMFPVRLPLEVF